MKNKYSCLEHILFLPTILNDKKLKKKLKNKTVLITGASFGIGASLAYKLAKTEANLILVARTESKLQAIKKAIEIKGGKVEIFAINLSNIDEVDKLIDYLKNLENGIDIFINNAGKSIKRSIEKSLDRYHDFTRTMALNYNAPVKLMLGLIPILKKNKGQGINISAINVLLAPAPHWAAYQASKSAFDQWFRCVAPELNAKGVKTTSIYLPLVKTRMIIPTEAYRKMPAMSTKHVADTICKAIISKKTKYAPWWLIFGQLGSVIFRRLFEKISSKF